MTAPKPIDIKPAPDLNATPPGGGSYSRSPDGELTPMVQSSANDQPSLTQTANTAEPQE